MPKIRGIKPETWTDAKFVRLSPLARLLFIGMWNLACDNGHVEDDVVQLKIRLLPMDNCDVADLIDEMVQTRQVERRPGYLKVIKLPEHQHIDLFWLTLCEHCDDDPESAFSEADKKGRKKGARTVKAGHKSGTSLAPDCDVEVSGVDVELSGVESDIGAASAAPARAVSKSKRATQRPADFHPTQAHIDLAAELGVDLRAEWQQFCDHHDAKGSTYKDWSAALRTWIRNAKKFGRTTGAAGSARQQADADMFDRMAQRAQQREAQVRGEIA